MMMLALVFYLYHLKRGNRPELVATSIYGLCSDCMVMAYIDALDVWKQWEANQ